ncbi:hypothetical protein [Sinomonas sp. ASV322]|uniref:hypothetical protein n=1 Tax=Sinomonas sp. ASV322 TaxID=3041920 RepID=UPI0027DCA223|nr:hypothetical protein [Sinomonas sp. ASV322]MDQ4503473.1 hypothetical protein [Sinomonas sp. ASV322]
MYAALWRALPGGRPVKALLCVVLFAAVVVALFAWVFPAVAPLLPLDNATLNAPASAPPSP